MPNPKPDAKAKAPAPGVKPRKAAPAPIQPAEPPGPVVAMPLFRRHDWLALVLTTVLTLAGYLWTLAPDVTLEDSGELAVASFYAGVPHPPGYPVWTLYTWLFTVLLPFSNIAWRVAVATAVAAALSSGVLALMVSRVNGLLIDSLDLRKSMAAGLHQAICVVCAVAAGLMIGFNGFMWSQAVIVEVYPLSVLSLVLTFVFLLHYVCAPNQRRYLYWAAFMFGVAFTNHQTLIVAAMGIEVIILMANPRLGRDAFLANSVIYLVGLVLIQNGFLDNIRSSPALMLIFNLVGIGSMVACAYSGVKTGGLGSELVPVGLSLLMWVLGAAFYLYMPVTGATNPPLNWGYPRTWDGFVHAFTRGQYEKTNPSLDPGRIFDQVLMLFEGAVEEFNLVYLLIALVPFLFWARLRKTEKGWILGLTAIYICLAPLLLWLLNPSPDRQSRDLSKVFFTASHVIIAMGFGYGLALISTVLAVEYQRARKWVMLGAALAGGIALFVVAATYGLVELFPPDHPSYFFGIAATKDPVHRLASIVALVLALSAAGLLALRPLQLNMRWFLVLLAILPVKTILTHWADNEQRGHLFGYWFGHDMFTPPFKDKTGQPLYPEMTRNAVLFGGTDPGRFNPTYMIFCESFIPPRCKPRDPKFDRRDVYLITQNALADPPYLNYIRAHYNRTTQLPYDTPFFQEMLRGAKEREKNLYTNSLAAAFRPIDNLISGFGARVEAERRAGTSYFEAEQFTDVARMSARLREGPQQDPFSRHLATLLQPGTRELLNQAPNHRLAKALASDLNRLLKQEFQDRLKLCDELRELEGSLADATNRRAQVEARLQAYRQRPEYLYPPDLLKALPLSEELRALIQQDLPTAARIRMGRRILEETYPELISPSPGGVYPDLEIHTPSPEESTKAYNDYMADAFQRKQLGQLRPGEELLEENGHVSISGQVAVMAINAMLCRVIFDSNPEHEFFIEESFPLEWMYPYLTPFGIIMKINRQPLASLDDDTLRRDHEFWEQYSERLVGNWITYDTTVKEICDWVDKVYVQRDMRGFKGDPRFIRDDHAQKSFSKLRSSIGGVYLWRVSNAKSRLEQQRMIKEADFAFRQALVYWPYSPDVAFRYAQLLSVVGRYEDALLIANTALKLDPFNPSLIQLAEQLKQMRSSAPQLTQARETFQQQEEQYRTNPGDLTNALALAQSYLENQMYSQATQVFGNIEAQLSPQWQAAPTNAKIGSMLVTTYLQLRQPVRAQIVLNKLIELPDVDSNTLIAAAQTYAQLRDLSRLETTLGKLVQKAPNSPEAWYDYAGVLATAQKQAPAFGALSNAFRLSAARRAADPKARDLRDFAAGDERMKPLRSMPQWQDLPK